MSRERVGIYGGTFDPPHVAHLAVAEAAREQGRLDRVIWVPAHTSPFKGGVRTSEAADRLEMVRRAVAHHPVFSVSSIEVERGGTSYTIDTLRQLESKLDGASLSLILGGDALAGFPRWRQPREILELVRVLVYSRPPHPSVDSLEAWLREHVDVIDAPPIELSATGVREHIARGGSGRYLVPDAVLAYVSENGLYRPITPLTEPPLRAS